MAAGDEMSAIMITLKVDGTQALFVLLDAAGSINRLGTGAVENTDRDMFIGVIEPALFEGLRAQLTPELLGWCGRSLADPSPEGRACELVIGFKRASGEELMTAWKYGSDSDGPPPEVAAFVLASLEATAPWFERQKVMTRSKR